MYQGFLHVSHCLFSQREVLFHLSSSLLTFVNESVIDLFHIVLACAPQKRELESKADVLLLY